MKNIKKEQLDTPYNQILGVHLPMSTPRDYIRSLEKLLRHPYKALDGLTEKEINDYLDHLTSLRRKSMAKAIRQKEAIRKEILGGGMV